MKPIKTFLFIHYRHRRQSIPHQQTHQSMLALGWILTAIIGLLFTALVVGCVLAYSSITRNLPSPSLLSTLLDPPNGLLLQPTKIYDRTGQHLLLTLDEGLQSPRQYIPLKASSGEQLPDDLVQATLLTMDPSFWNHPGFLFSDLTSSNNSTLAEILVSELMLSNEPASLTRNIRVRILAAQITSQYGRDKILEYYLNNAYYGHQIYGAEAASELYLGKSVSQLNLAEAALLAAVAKAPALNPFDAPDEARANQQSVLSALLKAGKITQAQAADANATPLTFKKPPAEANNPAKAFTALVENEVSAEIGQSRLERGGLVIITSLDYDLQLQLDCTVRTQLLRVSTKTSDASANASDGNECDAARLLPTLSFDNSKTTADLSKSLSASGLILDPQTGQILAMLGDTTLEGESNSLQSHPSGSLLTPFIYLAGFTRGMGPASLVWDIPSSLPNNLSNQVNPDGKFHGPVRVRTAMANDYLAPAAQLLNQIGSNVIWKSLTAFGLPDLSQEQSLPFSGGSLTPLQAAQAYAILADNGVMAGQVATGANHSAPLQMSGVVTVSDSNATVLLDWSSAQTRSILSHSLAYLVNNVLSDETARWASLGSSNPLAIGRQAAAKLGVTADRLDSWASGYTPQTVGVFWLGDTTTAIDSNDVAGIWHAMMQYTSRNLPVTNWSTPTEITKVNVCDPSGLLPTTACPNVVNEVFISGNEPSSTDNLYQTFEIDKETGRLATVFTSPDLVEQKTYLVVPEDARPWAEAAGLAIPPNLYDVIQQPTTLADANFSSPAMYTFLKGKVTLQGTAAGDSFAYFQVQVGKGLNPTEWFQIGETTKQPVKNGDLATWDTSQVDDGLYAVRLEVVKTDQEIQTAIILVTVDNTPPVASITSPVDGQTFTYQAGSSLTFQADASDSASLARVEWWVDGNLAGSLTSSPYNITWPEQIGNHSLVVKAYDQAGNITTTGTIHFSVVAK